MKEELSIKDDMSLLLWSAGELLRDPASLEALSHFREIVEDLEGKYLAQEKEKEK